MIFHHVNWEHKEEFVNNINKCYYNIFKIIYFFEIEKLNELNITINNKKQTQEEILEYVDGAYIILDYINHLINNINVSSIREIIVELNIYFNDLNNLLEKEEVKSLEKSHEWIQKHGLMIAKKKDIEQKKSLENNI